MGNETATASEAAQDVVDRIESTLYPEEAQEAEPIETEDEEVLEDAEELPEDDDSDSDEDEGSDDEVEDEISDEDASLAAYLGVDEDRLIVDDDGTVSLKAIIDGETKNVPLKELASSYQLQGHVNNKSIALENERKEFETAANKAASEIKIKLDGVSALTKVMEEQLLGDYNGIDWEGLRREDPAEWAVLRQEYSDKASRIQKAQELIDEERNRTSSDQQQKAQAGQQQYIQEERTKLIEKNPDWADNEKRAEALASMKTFMSSTYGYAPEDMDRVVDHRLIEVIKDAQKYRSGMKAAETKKVKVVPKFQKPGATKAQASSLAKARSVKAKKAAVRKSGGSVQSVANALLDRM